MRATSSGADCCARSSSSSTCGAASSRTILELVEFWAQTKKPLVLVATKVDKLPKAQHKPALEKLRAKARDLVPGVRMVGFSAETGQGQDELWAALLGVIRA